MQFSLAYYFFHFPFLILGMIGKLGHSLRPEIQDPVQSGQSPI